MMALEPCHASVAFDIESARLSLVYLSPSSYHVGSVTDFATKAQRIIKPHGECNSLPVSTGILLLEKVYPIVL